MNINELLRIGACFAQFNRAKQAFGVWHDYQLSLRTKKVCISHYPPALMLEPTNICNLKCPLCPSGNGSLKRNRGMMSLETFQCIVDQIYRKIGILMLWNQGESFLNPAIYDMLEYAQKRKMFTVVSTNASLSLDIARLANLGLGKIIVSMDGISKQSYDQYRINGNHQLVLDNLKEMGKEPKLKHNLVWQFIMLRHNEVEIPKVRALANTYRIQRLEFKTAQIYKQEDIRYLPLNPEYSRYRFKDSQFQLRSQILNRCRRLWTQPVINQDGAFSVCCYDKDVSIPIGNIHETDFDKLWFSDQINRVRETILHNRQAIPVCTNCGEGIIQRVSVPNSHAKKSLSIV